MLTDPSVMLPSPQQSSTARVLTRLHTGAGVPTRTHRDGRNVGSSSPLMQVIVFLSTVDVEPSSSVLPHTHRPHHAGAQVSRYRSHGNRRKQLLCSPQHSCYISCDLGSWVTLRSKKGSKANQN
ncbi:hypothetical protein J6590_014258 [Homalodisca vitripennis]|nr:hypothetical protein J6590_014258 [Homalodisca vitripennis]